VKGVYLIDFVRENMFLFLLIQTDFGSITEQKM